MKIRTISRSYKETVKERKNDISKQLFVKDPKYHPFMKEREYIRSLNSTKIERLLSRPFVTALTSHKEGVACIARHDTEDLVLSSGLDGSVVLWDLKDRIKKNEFTLDACSRGISFCQNDGILIGCAGNIKMYKVGDTIPSLEYKIEGVVNHIDSTDDFVVSTSNGCEVFDPKKITSKVRYGSEEYFFSKYNPSLLHIIGCAGRRDVFLIDSRIGKEFFKFGVGNRTNQICFSPTSGHVFVTANEDGNAYLHDMRFLKAPTGTFRNHINSVLCVDFHPSGAEIVTGSCDRTIRMFRVDERRSRDVYYNKRKQNVSGVKYSLDGQYIISGSDDGSLRLWKTEASMKLGPMNKREKESLDYSKVLKEKYKDVPELRTISTHRFLPKGLKNGMKQDYEHCKAVERKRAKRKAGSEK
jgi:WD repeat and SOF domain-containing protein 1